jgi:hypothetical protein
MTTESELDVLTNISRPDNQPPGSSVRIRFKDSFVSMRLRLDQTGPNGESAQSDIRSDP